MRILKGTLSFLLTIAAALGLSLLIRTYVFGTYLVPTASMEDTIQIGDMLVGERVSLHFGSPQYKDIITFTSPVSGETLIKRVIATGGQTVNLVDGQVYVDGEPLDELSYAQGDSYPLVSLASGVEISYPYTVPEGYLWVMGDNRENSSDSRYFGPVSVDVVSSHAVFIYWPLSRIGVLE